MPDSDNQKLTEWLRLEDHLIQPPCSVRDIQTRYPGLCAEDFGIYLQGWRLVLGTEKKRGVEYLAEFNAILLIFLYFVLVMLLLLFIFLISLLFLFRWLVFL